ncbi:MAG: 4Fe-4S dicluster domain-containing protein [Chitinivibrionales bacterium]|nr:4Fe-4S dicluster domain-containing protein [Chitinivibrionales bacterium]MBD3395294.1 4Fe-4S dicluster domain-containing protein [Chitinivibrionales bacterium]
MKATVDRDACTGCELCAQTCPAVFEMDDDLARAKMDEVPATEAENCRQAAAECPVDAISIDE